MIDKNIKEKKRVNFILQQYLQGLLNLIEEYETKKADELIIRGTTYIINDRTASRIGFQIRKTDHIQKLILIYNYFNILLTYSIAQGKLSFPKLSDTKTYETSIGNLIARKEYLKNLNEKLKSSFSKNSL